MGRGGSSEESSVSLFPFLSILACVIGALVLMITGLALSQMDNDGPDEEAVERAREYIALEKILKQEELAVAKLKPKIEEDRKLREEQKLLSEEMKRLQALVDNRDAERSKQEERKKEIEKELADLAEAFAVLQAQKDKGLQATDRLGREFVRRTTAPKGKTVKVAPTGGGFSHRMKPVFVEASKEGLRWYRKGGSVEIPRDKIKGHAAVPAMFAEAKKTESSLIIFVVREDGIDTWNAAKRVASEADVRHGNLPVFGTGELDLSLFGVK